MQAKPFQTCSMVMALPLAISVLVSLRRGACAASNEETKPMAAAIATAQPSAMLL